MDLSHRFQPGHTNGKGRKKGSKNKHNIDVREKFFHVYENMEEGKTGDQVFLEWGQKNKKLFYVLFSKLLPKNLDVDINVNKHEDFVRNLAADQLIEEAQAKQIEVPDTPIDMNAFSNPTKEEKEKMPDVINVKSFDQLKEIKEQALKKQKEDAKQEEKEESLQKVGLMPSVSHEKSKTKAKVKAKRKKVKRKKKVLKKITKGDLDVSKMLTHDLEMG